jgi:hypothetical protein
MVSFFDYVLSQNINFNQKIGKLTKIKIISKSLKKDRTFKVNQNKKTDP